jgi:hypothetical protein
VNGALVNKFSTETYPSFNYITSWNGLVAHTIGATSTNTEPFEGEMFDVFFIDGQALTPDVFGFYKQGKGYISAGSTQATDFRPGQWVPKTPRVIKTEINRRGGFGVNGFYLPMNDSRNFGADFHGDPNSIITLNEKLPQPRVGVASTASVGLGYTDALRADPYAANLVLALPFVSSGLCTNGTNVGVNTGFGDYSHIIRGSGSAKVGTLVGNVSIANTAGHYGSAVFFDGTDDYIDFGTNTDYEFGSGNFTIEFWRNKSRNSSTESYVSRLDSAGGSTTSAFWFGAVNNIDGFYWYEGSTNRSISTPSIITANQWDHLAAVRNGTTITLYLNGTAVGVSTGATYSLNAGTAKLRIGGDDVSGSTYDYQGYIQDLRVYKGVAKYTGGFDVPRPYTPVGIATWRQVPDTTANNFATMNPLIGATPRSGGTITSTIVTYTDGNLTTRNSANSGYAPAMQSHSNVGMTTGKWYWEVSNFSTTSNETIGISKGNQQISPNGSGTGIESYLYYFSNTGALILDINTPVVSATLNNSPGVGISSTADVIGFAFDVTNGSLSVYRNGVLNNTATGISVTSNVREWFTTKSAGGSGTASGMSWNFGQNPTFSGNTTAGTFTDTNGKGLFKYQPPSGFLALCEDNLPTPAISDPGKHFKTVLYAGTSASRSIVGVGFTPDLVWIKERNGADNHRLVDSVRGPIRELYSSLTNAEAIDSGGVLSFDSDGFSLGNGNSYNESGINHVAWCWRAGAGTTSTNTNGSVTSVVSVNQDAGFSIVSYTGNGVPNATVGHGLGKVPAFGVLKCRDTNGASNEWRVQHKGLTSGYYIVLNTTAAQSGPIISTSFGSLGTFTSSSTVTLQAGSSDSTTPNENGKRYIMYLWAEIENFSKFGSYVGNGNADGPFVYCGFKPAFIIFKNVSAVGNWVMKSNHISSNPNGYTLLPDASDTEYAPNNTEIDFLSNGFKNRTTSSLVNGSGNTIIFAAFAESPFQTANSK